MKYRRILIIRPSAIGDIVMASPMIDALRQGRTDAYLAWLVEPGLVDLLRSHPGLNAVIPWPKQHWRMLARQGRWMRLLREVVKFRRELRGHRFDLALDVQGLLRSRLLAWFSGAGTRIGLTSKEPGEFLLSEVISRGPKSDLMSSEYRFMIQHLGLEAGDFAPALFVSEEEAQAAREALREAGVTGPFAVLAPFTTRPQKHWFDDRWAELAALIAQRLGLRPVLLGGSGDREHAQAIADASPADVAILAGRTTLGASAAVIRESSLVIGVDTGLTHMGTAFGRPTVALFGSTCPYLETPLPGTRVLYHQLTCSPCRRNPTCDGRFDCMVALGVDLVADTAAEVFARETAR